MNVGVICRSCFYEMLTRSIRAIARYVIAEQHFRKVVVVLKKESPFPITFPVELANGCVGYVPTEEALGPHGGGYETRLTAYSNLEPAAGRKMVEAGLALAGEMKPGVVPTRPPHAPFSNAGWSYGSVPPELK